MAFSIGELVGYLRLDSAQFDSGVMGAQRSLNLAGESAVKMGAQVDRGAAALAGAGKQASLASENAARLRASQLSLVAAQERYNALVESGSASTGRLASAQATLIRANERVKAATPSPDEPKKLAGSIGGLASSAGSAALSLGKMALGFAALGAVFKAADMVRQASDFQRQMLLIHTQAGASTAEVKSMTSALLAMAPAVATGPDQLAVSMYHVESVGLRGGKALDVVRIAAEGAKVGVADLEQTTNALTATVASGISGVQNMQQAMGALNAIVGAGDMKLSDLNEALGGGILTVVKGYGLSLRDVGAALATFGDNNIRGADAATMLRMAVQAMAVPAKEGAKQLEALGLQTDSLRKDMEQGGLNKALQDLSTHLQAAHISADQMGGTITEVFGKKAGPGLAVLLGQMDRLQQKYVAIDMGAKTFGDAWTETTHNASFAAEKLRTGFETAALSLYNKLLPAVGEIANDMSTVLPAALHLAGDALVPLGAAWEAISATLRVVSPIIKDVAGALQAMSPVLGPLAAGVLAVWAGFKAGELVVAAVRAVQSAVQGMATRSVLALDAVLEKWTQTGASAAAAGAESAAGAAAIAGSAEAAAASVKAAGAEAATGWAAMAGPLGAAAVLIGTVAFMFHRSAAASKEATDAAKAYQQALSSGGGEATILDAITKQLSDNQVPQTIEKLNAALGHTAVSGSDFVTAIEKGGPALAGLRKKLEDVVAADNNAAAKMSSGGVANKQARAMYDSFTAAKKLLSDLNTQYSSLTGEAQKELTDAKAFGIAASSIEKTNVATEVGSKTAATYAQMMGIVVDQNGIAAVSSDTLNAAVSHVADAYGSATQSGSEFLDALQSFSASAGTAADRAALIGATLKAANGDALSYIGAMSGAVAANQALIDGFQSDRDKIAQLNADLAQLGAKSDTANLSTALLAAQATSTATSLANQNAKVTDLSNKLKSGALTTAQLASAHKQLASAQASAGVAAARLAVEQSKLSGATGVTNTQKLAEIQAKLAKAYADSELAAINLSKGTIDYTKGGAPALVQQLQGIQDAAMKAAEATYQHELATKDAATAANDAYSVYVTETRKSLIDEASQIGITKDQAKKLADQYFGMPKDVKTQIEAEGTDPILDVLNKIGKLLAAFTGQQWDIPVNITGNALAQLSEVKNKLSAGSAGHQDPSADTNWGGNDPASGITGHIHGFGGTLASGWNLIGDRGQEWVNKETGRVLTAGQKPPTMQNGTQSVTINQYFPTSAPVQTSFEGPRRLRDAAAEIGRPR